MYANDDFLHYCLQVAIDAKYAFCINTSSVAVFDKLESFNKQTAILFRYEPDAPVSWAVAKKEFPNTIVSKYRNLCQLTYGYLAKVLEVPCGKNKDRFFFKDTWPTQTIPPPNKRAGGSYQGNTIKKSIKVSNWEENMTVHNYHLFSSGLHHSAHMKMISYFVGDIHQNRVLAWGFLDIILEDREPFTYLPIYPFQMTPGEWLHSCLSDVDGIEEMVDCHKRNFLFPKSEVAINKDEYIILCSERFNYLPTVHLKFPRPCTSDSCEKILNIAAFFHAFAGGSVENLSPTRNLSFLETCISAETLAVLERVKNLSDREVLCEYKRTLSILCKGRTNDKILSQFSSLAELACCLKINQKKSCYEIATVFVHPERGTKIMLAETEAGKIVARWTDLVSNPPLQGYIYHKGIREALWSAERMERRVIEILSKESGASIAAILLELSDMSLTTLREKHLEETMKNPYQLMESGYLNYTDLRNTLGQLDVELYYSSGYKCVDHPGTSSPRIVFGKGRFHVVAYNPTADEEKLLKKLNVESNLRILDDLYRDLQPILANVYPMEECTLRIITQASDNRLAPFIEALRRSERTGLLGIFRKAFTEGPWQHVRSEKTLQETIEIAIAQSGGPANSLEQLMQGDSTIKIYVRKMSGDTLSIMTFTNKLSDMEIYKVWNNNIQLEADLSESLRMLDTANLLQSDLFMQDCNTLKYLIKTSFLERKTHPKRHSNLLTWMKHNLTFACEKIYGNDLLEAETIVIIDDLYGHKFLNQMIENEIMQSDGSHVGAIYMSSLLDKNIDSETVKIPVGEGCFMYCRNKDPVVFLGNGTGSTHIFSEVMYAFHICNRKTSLAFLLLPTENCEDTLDAFDDPKISPVCLALVATRDAFDRQSQMKHIQYGTKPIDLSFMSNLEVQLRQWAFDVERTDGQTISFCIKMHTYWLMTLGQRQRDRRAFDPSFLSLYKLRNSMQSNMQPIVHNIHLNMNHTFGTLFVDESYFRTMMKCKF